MKRKVDWKAFWLNLRSGLREAAVFFMVQSVFWLTIQHQYTKAVICGVVGLLAILAFSAIAKKS